MTRGGARQGSGRPRKGRERHTFTLAMGSSIEGLRERFDLESKGEAVDLAIAALVMLETLKGDRFALEGLIEEHGCTDVAEAILRESAAWLARVEGRARESSD